MLGLFAQLGKSRKDPEAKMDVPTFQSRLSAMPVRAQFTLQQALAGLAAQAPSLVRSTAASPVLPLLAPTLRPQSPARVEVVWSSWRARMA